MNGTMTGNGGKARLKFITDASHVQRRRQRVRQGVSLLLVLALLFGAMPVTEAGAAHTHTDDCYSGVKHVHSEEAGCYTWGPAKGACVVCDGTGKTVSACTGYYQYYSAINYSNPYTCSSCGQPGGSTGYGVRCPVCGESFIAVSCHGCGGCNPGGTWELEDSRYTIAEWRNVVQNYYGGLPCKPKCPSCKGTGEAVARTCTTCGGDARVDSEAYTCPGKIQSKFSSSSVGYQYTYSCNFCGYQHYAYGDGMYGGWDSGDPSKKKAGADCGLTIKFTRCPDCNAGKQYYGLQCTKTEGTYYDGSGNVCEPLCSKVVVGLVPEKKTQTISAGQLINADATATFLDGTSKKVSCNYTGFAPAKYNVAQTVTLSYGEYVGNAKTPGAKTATITVTIQGYFTVTVTSNDVSKGTVGGGGEKLAGSSVKVSAVPKGRNHFTGWYENGVCVSTLQEYTFTMPARHVSLTGRFQAIPVSLEVTPSSYTVYNGSEPEYTVKVKYSDETEKTLSYDEYGKSGFTQGAGIKVVRFTYTEGSITVEAVLSITVLRNTAVCRYGHEYELSDYDVDYGCPVCADTLVRIDVSPTEQSVEPGVNPVFVVTGIYQDGHSAPVLSGYTTDFETGKAGTQYVTVTYRELSKVVVVHVVKTFTCSVCYTKYPANADLSDPGCPECKRTCVHLSVSPQSQMVEQGLPMNITVTATFRDGHTEEVTDWTSNYQPYVIGKQQVTVLYGGQGAIAEVIVVAKKAVCINCGTEYDPSVGGCPMCGHILKGIRATTKDGTNMAVKGIKPEWKVYGIYLDGHETLVEGGYTVTGLDIYVLGLQSVTVKYQGFSCVVVVEVVEGVGKTVCVNGHVYSLNQDGSDPGCPFCTVDADDKLEDYYTLSYGQDFLEQLYRDKVYYLKKGDSVTITVTKKKETGLTGWLKWLFGSFGKDDRMSFGGIVGN